MIHVYKTWTGLFGGSEIRGTTLNWICRFVEGCHCFSGQGKKMQFKRRHSMANDSESIDTVKAVDRIIRPKWSSRLKYIVSQSASVLLKKQRGRHTVGDHRGICRCYGFIYFNKSVLPVYYPMNTAEHVNTAETTYLPHICLSKEMILKWNCGLSLLTVISRDASSWAHTQQLSQLLALKKIFFLNNSTLHHLISAGFFFFLWKLKDHR